jgi:hypothetical protein
MDDPPSPAEQILKNCRLFICMESLLGYSAALQEPPSGGDACSVPFRKTLLIQVSLEMPKYCAGKQCANLSRVAMCTATFCLSGNFDLRQNPNRHLPKFHHDMTSRSDTIFRFVESAASIQRRS